MSKSSWSETRPFTDPEEGVTGESVSPLAAKVARLTEEFRRRVGDAAIQAEETLRDAITERLTGEFDQKLGTELGILRQELQRRFDTARAEWEAERSGLEEERRRLHQEIEELRQLGEIGKVSEEIQGVEARLAAFADEVAAMVEDPEVRLSEVMRKNAEQAELRAYLRGLRFRTGRTADAGQTESPAEEG